MGLFLFLHDLFADEEEADELAALYESDHLRDMADAEVDAMWADSEPAGPDDVMPFDPGQNGDGI